MGITIFLMAVAVETAFAVFCIITKSDQQKIRSIIWIAAFTGFVLLSVLSVIDWGFRYYTLAVLLFLLAVAGVTALILGKNEKRVFNTVRVILKAVGMTILIFIFTLTAIIFPQYKELKPTGEYKAAAIAYTYTDPGRIETYTDTGENRKLNVELWYPENAEGKYPLVVFSHGSFGIRSSNESLYNELASHGYVVCSIDHTYQCFFTANAEGRTIRMDMGYMREVMAEDARSNRQQSYEYYQKWMKIRIGDINFVIDSILTEAMSSNADMVYKLVDTTKIGVLGHSLGGSAALGIGRIREDINAVMALESPFMYDITGVKDGEFVFEDEMYPVPVLNVYSDSIWSILAERPQYAQNYTLLSNTNAAAFNVHISGAGHLTLTDLAYTSPFLTRVLNGHKTTINTEYCLRTINKISLEFFDCYLKSEGEFTLSDSRF